MRIYLRNQLKLSTQHQNQVQEMLSTLALNQPTIQSQCRLDQQEMNQLILDAKNTNKKTLKMCFSSGSFIISVTLRCLGCASHTIIMS